jgi:hypothetical protein
VNFLSNIALAFRSAPAPRSTCGKSGGPSLRSPNGSDGEPIEIMPIERRLELAGERYEALVKETRRLVDIILNGHEG